LLKSVYPFKRGRRKSVVFPRSMLDARYLMLDIQDCTGNEIQNHPVSSYPGRSSERAKTGNQYLSEATSSP